MNEMKYLFGQMEYNALK